MKTYTISPRSITGTRMTIEAESLVKAADRFCQTIGLISASQTFNMSGGVEVLDLIVGTGRLFTIYDANEAAAAEEAE